MRFLNNGIDIPDDLLWALDNEQVIFFCGAGVSMAKAGLPDFNTLTQFVLDDLGAESNNPARKLFEAANAITNNYGVPGLASSDRIFGQLERYFPRKLINSSVAKALQTPTDVNLTAHKTILKLARLSCGNTRLITTNFDRLFEQAGRSMTPCSKSTLPHIEFNPTDWGIIHLHGIVTPSYDGASFDDFVLSSADFGTAYLSSGWARNFVQSVLDRFVAVFVGYSADDPPVRYLLEGLRQGDGLRHKAYAFQKGPDDEAVSQWDEKGVEALVFNDGYEQLWNTLEAWTERAKSPNKWRSKMLRMARQAPSALAPHQRGVISHIVRTKEGAAAFRSTKPSPPSEWICVFDSGIRYSEPQRVRGEDSSGQIVDPFDLYHLDNDPAPYSVSADGQQEKRLPDEAWSALTANISDLQELHHRQVAQFTGPYAASPAILPDRINHLAEWLVKVCHEPAAIWWAARQFSIHPAILERIDFEISHINKKHTRLSKDSWNAIREYHEFQFFDDHDVYGLQTRLNQPGCDEAVAREYARFFNPQLTASRFGRRPIPPNKKEKLALKNLVNLTVHFTDGVLSLDVPDHYVRSLCPKLRQCIELTIDLSNRYESYFDLCSIEPNEPSSDGGRETKRDYGISARVLKFLSIFKRLTVIDPEAALAELESWPVKDRTFERMRVWALGCLQFAPIDRYCLELMRLNNDGFWHSKGERDLLLGLANRWSELSSAQRTAIEGKIRRGPRKVKWLDEEQNKVQKARQALSRLLWLSKQGCVFGFDLEAATDALKSRVPNWSDGDEDGAAEALDGRSGWVSTDPDPSILEGTPSAQILPTILSMETRPFRSFVEKDPFLGLCTTDPKRALAALAYAQTPSAFHRNFWDTFLNPEHREGDTSTFSDKIAAELLKLEPANFESIALSISRWFRKAGPNMKPRNSKALWNTFLTAFNASEEAGRSCIIDGQEGRDWLLSAINSAVGNLAETLFLSFGDYSFARGEGFSEEWKAQSESLFDTEFEAHCFALTVFAQRLNFIYYVDPDWAASIFLPIMVDEQIGTPEHDALWTGFARSGQAPASDLLVELKPKLFELSGQSIGRWDRLRHFIAASFVAAWALREKPDGSSVISDQEYKSMLLSTDQKSRIENVRIFQRWSSQEDSDSDWSILILKFIRDVWPKQKTIRSSKSSIPLIELTLSQKENFPETVDALIELVSRVEDDWYFCSVLKQRGDELASKHPYALLKLLHHALSENSQRWPRGTPVIIEATIASEPKLRSDLMYQELSSRMS